MSKKKIAEQRMSDDGSIQVKNLKTGKVKTLNTNTINDVKQEDFVKLTTRSYAQYAMDTLIRYIPRIEDGLRLSSRRVIYEIMGTQNLTKAARVVGNVIGRLHP